MKNSIWRKSSYRQLTKNKIKILHGTRVPYFYAGFFKQLDFWQIEFFIETQFLEN